MLTNFNLLLKEIQRLNIIVDDCYFIENIGVVKAGDIPKEKSKSFQKVDLLGICLTDENFLKKLQSDSINEVMMLNKEQLTNCLNRLMSLKNCFSKFYKFWGLFYVKFAKKEIDNRDLFDLKIALEGDFITNYIEQGQINFEFVHDLQDDVMLKSGILDGLINQVNEILGPNKIIDNHTNELDFYLSNDFNINIYRELEQNPNPFDENIYPLDIKPLEFFNLLYKKYDDAKLYFDKYLSFETWVNQNIHSVNLEYNSKISHYLFDKFCELLKTNVECNQLAQSTYDNVVRIVKDSISSDYYSILYPDEIQPKNEIEVSNSVSDCPKYTAKYYAAFHYLRSLIDNRHKLHFNSEGELKATELQLDLSELYPTISSQGIYRKIYLIIRDDNKLHGFLKKEMLGERTWKSKIKEIAVFFRENKVIDELDNY